MQIKTALTIRDNAIHALSDCYHAGKHFGQSSRELEQRKHTVLERTCVTKAPQWVRAYCDGYWRCLIDRAYRYDLVYGGFVAGTFYSTHRNRDDYYDKHGIAPSAYADDGLVQARGHYWIENLKPFFTGPAMEDAA